MLIQTTVLGRCRLRLKGNWLQIPPYQGSTLTLTLDLSNGSLTFTAIVIAPIAIAICRWCVGGKLGCCLRLRMGWDGGD